MAEDAGDISGVSRETTEKLKAFARSVTSWTHAINLISQRTVDDIWARHITDSLQLLSFSPAQPKLWCDLGSGAGFPGLVVAIANAEANPECHHLLIESDRRKAAFLAMQCSTFRLNARVIPSRIETAKPAHADVVSARALAPMKQLLSYALRHGRNDTSYLFPKGRNVVAELDSAKVEFEFDAETRPSMTDPEGTIVILRNLALRRTRE